MPDSQGGSVTQPDTGEGLIEAIRSRMADTIKRRLNGQTDVQTAIAGLTLHGQTSATKPASFIYEPSFAFIVRGAKKVILGTETHVYDQSQFLLTSIGLPTIVQVLNASYATPYFSIKLDIDLDLASEVQARVDQLRLGTPEGDSAMSIGPVTISLATAAMRLLDLLEQPNDIAMLARPVQEEILYRLLVSPVGGCLRQTIRSGTHANRVAKAVRYLRENFARPIRTEKLADTAGLGESTLHHHFRALTAMSPLQYQKHLRLHHARHLMVSEGLGAGPAAHRVGYESASQFNRDYRKLFGAPPKSDVRSMLVPNAAEIVG